MNPAQKALWYIESHLDGPLTLDDIAGVAGVSRFHIVRAFASATGFSVMRYARARRLSNAARALSAGAPDILSLALEADYSSHEAFTRAFRDHFGVTPEAVRAATCLDHLKLQEPIVMANIRVLATDLEFPEGPVVMPDGSVVLVEIRGKRLTRVYPDGRKEVVAQIPGGPNGAALGPDGKMYICNNGGFSWIPTGKMIMWLSSRQTKSATRSTRSVQLARK